MKKLLELPRAARFIYGGMEWVKMEDIGAGTLCLTADVPFNRAFDEEDCNDWRKSSLRKVLNNEFINELVCKGADPAAFMDWTSDLSFADGTSGPGPAVDKIALLSIKLHRKFDNLIPKTCGLSWTLTPWSCLYVGAKRAYVEKGVCMWNSYDARSTGAFGKPDKVNVGETVIGGVRPLCYLKSDTLIQTPGEKGEETEQGKPRTAMEMEAACAILSVLRYYPKNVWGYALGAVIVSLYSQE